MASAKNIVDYSIIDSNINIPTKLSSFRPSINNELPPHLNMNPKLPHQQPIKIF